MNDYVKNIREKLDVITMTREDANQLCKDRLDFGFDSIYFRYAELCDELALYKAKVDKTDPLHERKVMGHRKMHFYNALEQLLHAHEGDEHGTNN